uniref:Zinc-ribbon domain-containing protein n=1 Tax=viral metagenome TaxID=1070528 RepID=A0A6C0JN40_9ZZZZ
MGFIKTIDDYIQLGKEKGFEYVLHTIPKNTHKSSYQGWKCSKGYLFNSCYKSIKKGTKCAVCSGKSKKTLSDYKKHAISKNLKYIFNYIPKSVKEMDGNTPKVIYHRMHTTHCTAVANAV